ncbi:MAG: FecR domain-containing protein [Gammaproteobacteria bacterium]|nr:FecR domain-containing protein [Gammaproteobacteria bacterium]
MNEQPRKPDTTNASAGDEAVAAAVKLAGKREVPPQGDYDRIYATVAAALKTKVAAKKRSRLGTTGLALAAGVAGLAVGAALLWQNAVPTSSPLASTYRIAGNVAYRKLDNADWDMLGTSTALDTAGTLRSEESGAAGLLLDNGTSLRVAENTTLRLLAGDRMVLEKGKIYIDTKASQKVRLEITLPSGVVRNRGTRFEALAADGFDRLRTRDGRISLDHKGKQLESGAGDELVIEADGDISFGSVAADDPDWYWAEELAPSPELDGRPLSELLEWVQRETGRALTYDDNATRQRAWETILHGSVSNMPPLDTLRAMLATTDLRYRLLDDGTILIFSPR